MKADPRRGYPQGEWEPHDGPLTSEQTTRLDLPELVFLLLLGLLLAMGLACNLAPHPQAPPPPPPPPWAAG